MLNLFFFSSQNDLKIRYLKSTVKFSDKNGESSDKTKGLTSISFKIWLKKENLTEIPKLYLLIKYNNFIILYFDEKYNHFLTEESFRRTAGIVRAEGPIVCSKYAVEQIEEFEEDETLEGKKLLIPRDIQVKEINPEIVNENLENQKYIKVLKILPIDEETEKSVKIILNDNPIIGFQFRILIENIPNQDTLKEWGLSSRPWSVDIGFLEKWKYEDIYNFLRDFSLKHPRVLDLWFNIPHNHIFVASSPAHTGVFKLKTEDIQYKTYEEYENDKKKLLKKIKTLEGDYAVKISSMQEKPRRFSILCMSPFLPEEDTNKLKNFITEYEEKRKEIEEFQKDILKYMIGIFGIFVAIFSFIIISGNTALTIPITDSSSFWKIFSHVSAVLLPIFLFLGMLLVISIWFTRKK